MLVGKKSIRAAGVFLFGLGMICVAACYNIRLQREEEERLKELEVPVEGYQSEEVKEEIEQTAEEENWSEEKRMLYKSFYENTGYYFPVETVGKYLCGWDKGEMNADIINQACRGTINQEVSYFSYMDISYHIEENGNKSPLPAIIKIEPVSLNVVLSHIISGEKINEDIAEKRDDFYADYYVTDEHFYCLQYQKSEEGTVVTSLLVDGEFLYGFMNVRPEDSWEEYHPSLESSN